MPQSRPVEYQQRLRAAVMAAAGLVAAAVAGLGWVLWTWVGGAPGGTGLALGALALGVGFGLAWWQAGRVVRDFGDPVVELAHRAGMMQGEHDRVPAALPDDGPLQVIEEVLGRLAADISERDATLANYGSGIERRLAGQTAELRATVRILATAKQEADQAEFEKAEFLATISHELRTLVNDLLGFGQLLEGRLGQPQAADHLREMMRAGRQLLVLVEEFADLETVDLARIEAGRLEVKLEPIALLSLVEECHQVMAPVAAAVGVQITLAEASRDVTALADRGQLKQVLLNLLRAAIRRAPEGGSVALSVARVEDATHIVVSDAGTPDSDDELKALFEMPSDAAGEADRLGLALSRRMVNSMRGSIQAGRAGAVGRRVCVVLPPAPAATRPTGEDERPSAETPRRTVLCIEDNAANLRLIERIMAGRPDLRLLAVSDPCLALEVAASHRPELILLDINLPGMDGFEVLKRLRTDESTRGLPVIAVTAFATDADLRKGASAGFDEYFTKPLDVQRFIDMLARRLPQRG